jgi:hypothetical protein
MSVGPDYRAPALARPGLDPAGLLEALPALASQAAGLIGGLAPDPIQERLVVHELVEVGVEALGG